MNERHFKTSKCGFRNVVVLRSNIKFRVHPIYSLNGQYNKIVNMFPIITFIQSRSNSVSSNSASPEVLNFDWLPSFPSLSGVTGNAPCSCLGSRHERLQSSKMYQNVTSMHRQKILRLTAHKLNSSHDVSLLGAGKNPVHQVQMKCMAY